MHLSGVKGQPRVSADPRDNRLSHRIQAASGKALPGGILDTVKALLKVTDRRAFYILKPKFMDSVGRQAT